MAQEKWSIDEKLTLVLAALQKEASIAELCRRHGVTETTFYRWRSQFLEGGRQGLASNGKCTTARERELIRENEELKKTVGELALDNRLSKNLKELSR